MTIAVTVSLLIGLAAAGLGLWNRHKINTINGQIAPVPATSIISPSTGQTISGVVSLDALPLATHIKSVQFVATGGSSHGVLLATGAATVAGFGARWNSTNLPNGTYQISSVGYSTTGQTSQSPAVTVSIQNP